MSECMKSLMMEVADARRMCRIKEREVRGKV